MRSRKIRVELDGMQMLWRRSIKRRRFGASCNDLLTYFIWRKANCIIWLSVSGNEDKWHATQLMRTMRKYQWQFDVSRNRTVEWQLVRFRSIFANAIGNQPTITDRANTFLCNFTRETIGNLFQTILVCHTRFTGSISHLPVNSVPTEWKNEWISVGNKMSEESHDRATSEKLYPIDEWTHRRSTN